MKIERFHFAGYLTALAVIASVSLFFSSCKKEKFTTDSGAKLEFSADTVLFDTVFSTIGSTTQMLKVYNRHSESIRISSIRLEGGNASQYRINVDGMDGVQHSDVELFPNDSIFIFVEVTVDPSNTNTPFVVEDRILFETNGNSQSVQLAAWGQDAYFHGGTGGLTVLPCAEIWNNDKPHVIYGIVAVDSNCVLTINQGTQVHVHSKSGLYIYKGTLNIAGSYTNEVVFQGDRLEATYRDTPGQWGIQLDYQAADANGPAIGTITRGGIWIYQSPGSSIDYAIIKNGQMGIQVDTTGTPYSGSTPSVQITNTKVLNMSGIGIWAQGGYVKGVNVLAANCGESCAYFGIGGKYVMDNCTFGNYWSGSTRTSPAFALNNYYEDINQVIQVRPLIGCRFTNCVMYGNNAQLTDFGEFVIDSAFDSDQDYQFVSCLVDSQTSVADGTHFSGMKNGQSPPFCDPSVYNFKLSTFNNYMIGVPASFFSSDLVQYSNFSTPDWIGCYDYTEDESSRCSPF